MVKPSRSVLSWVVIGAMFLVFIALQFRFISIPVPPTETEIVQRVCAREHRDCSIVLGTMRIRSSADILLVGSAAPRPVTIGDLIIRFPDAVFVERMY